MAATLPGPPQAGGTPTAALAVAARL